MEFLIHAVKYLFPARRGAEARGIPTSWAVPPLSSELAEVGALPPVWPDPEGGVRGLALEPLHPMVPEAARSDPLLAERLALVDALRSGEGPRVFDLATELLQERIRA